MQENNLIGTIVTGGTSGLIAGLLLIIVLLIRGTLVPGYVYQAAMTKLGKFEDLAYKAMALAERAAQDGKAT